MIPGRLAYLGSAMHGGPLAEHQLFTIPSQNGISRGISVSAALGNSFNSK